MRSFGLITNNKLLGELSLDQLKEFIPSFKEIYLKKKRNSLFPGNLSQRYFSRYQRPNQGLSHLSRR